MALKIAALLIIPRFRIVNRLAGVEALQHAHGDLLRPGSGDVELVGDCGDQEDEVRGGQEAAYTAGVEGDEAEPARREKLADEQRVDV